MEIQVFRMTVVITLFLDILRNVSAGLCSYNGQVNEAQCCLITNILQNLLFVCSAEDRKSTGFE